MKNNNHPYSQQEYSVPFSFSSGNKSHMQCDKQSYKQCDTECGVCCPHFDLCKKRIFIVGGVERMEALYRAFVEGNGGLLDYHSGSMQGGTKKLEKCLQRADLIICPINCNSHGACVKVKNMAKKFGKNFHMLPTGSLSAIKRLLQESYSV